MLDSAATDAAVFLGEGHGQPAQLSKLLPVLAGEALFPAITLRRVSKS